MKRRTADEPVERFRRRKVEAEATAIRERLDAWARANIEALRDADPEVPEEDLSDRQHDAVESLIAIADMAGERWAKRARTALVNLFTDDANAPTESLSLRCLADCREVLGTAQGNTVRSQWLVDRLLELEGAPWRDRNLAQNNLAFLLKEYGIKPKKIRFTPEGGVSMPLQGYELGPFRDAWKRYLPAVSQTV